MNEEEFAELAAGYSLDALSPEDLTAFETARAQHPEWERLVTTDAATAVMLAESVTPVEPPAGARDALFARIGVTRPNDAEPPAAEPPAAEALVTEALVAEPTGPLDEPPVDEPVEPSEAAAPVSEAAPDTGTIQAISRRNWTRGMLGLAASLVLLVGLGFGAVTLGQFLNRSPAAVALDRIEAAPDTQSSTAAATDGGTATIHWSESVGKVVLVSDGLAAIDRNQSFELWYIRDGKPVSAGTFEDPSSTTVLEGAMKPGDSVAVTVEQQGGSPSGAPTSDPIVTIPTS